MERYARFVGLTLAFLVVTHVVGYIAIIAPRLFLFPTRVPGRACPPIGIAVCWSICVFLASGHKQQYVEVEVWQNGRVQFVQPPDIQHSANYFGIFADDPSYNENTPLYLHGVVNGKNREFKISLNPTEIVPADCGEHGRYVQIRNKADPHASDAIPLTKKEHKTEKDKSTIAIITLVAWILGGITWAVAQLHCLVSVLSSLSGCRISDD